MRLLGCEERKVKSVKVDAKNQPLIQFVSGSVWTRILHKIKNQHYPLYGQNPFKRHIFGPTENFYKHELDANQSFIKNKYERNETERPFYGFFRIVVITQQR